MASTVCIPFCKHLIARMSLEELRYLQLRYMRARRRQIIPTEVFSIPELAENIFRHLKVEDIFVLTGTTRAFANLVNGTVKLQKAMVVMHDTVFNCYGQAVIIFPLLHLALRPLGFEYKSAVVGAFGARQPFEIYFVQPEPKLHHGYEKVGHISGLKKGSWQNMKMTNAPITIKLTLSLEVE